MALTKEQVLTTLYLPEFGRSQALGLMKYASKKNISVTTDKELMELIDEAFDDGFVKDIPEYYLSDFTQCRSKAERIMEDCTKQRIGITAYDDEDFPKQFRSLISRGKETEVNPKVWTD